MTQNKEFSSVDSGFTKSDCSAEYEYYPPKASP